MYDTDFLRKCTSTQMRRDQIEKKSKRQCSNRGVGGCIKATHRPGTILTQKYLWPILNIFDRHSTQNLAMSKCAACQAVQRTILTLMVMLRTVCSFRPGLSVLKRCSNVLAFHLELSQLTHWVSCDSFRLSF